MYLISSVAPRPPPVRIIIVKYQAHLGWNFSKSGSQGHRRPCPQNTEHDTLRKVLDGTLVFCCFREKALGDGCTCGANDADLPVAGPSACVINLHDSAPL